MHAVLRDAAVGNRVGTNQVGAGRLLTAWSVAGVAGPLIVNSIADARRAAGAHKRALYRSSFEVMIVLLVVAFAANEATRAVNARFHEPADALASERAEAVSTRAEADARPLDSAARMALIAGSWTCVLAPFAFGAYELLLKTAPLFT